MTDADASPSFRLAYVPGVTPTKWVRIWNERLPDVPLTLVPVTAADAPDQLRGGGADAGLVRLPIDRTGLSAIPLYTEIPVVVAPKDHVVAAVDEVSIADLADEIVLHPHDDILVWDNVPGLPAQDRPATTADAIELVAAGIGLLIVPQSLARLHHRKDLVYRTVSDGPESRIALSWPEDETTELVEEFIGIVRGRTVNSSRGRTPTPAQPKKKRPAAAAARQKPAAGARTSRSGSGTKGGKKGKPRRRS
ncbi:LysR substrate binding domain-containing protein [Rhodococcus wratislaviensis]|uniref:LysR family transcriptional regulator n=1 Tax=Rhodococcus wratislaviensis TaxID=44752 RepID=A0AB38F9P2_RHOWR|nr:LysR family substrate-binding domain-containing protein [Rhodococcus wratislaviensis]REE71661.1 LysR substrate binding domain-containing protein [Rhodococcus wratislaviensis]SPZ38228.1 LysR family transcriptional regulator [Rhodococcus wratislaviensis]